MSDTISHKGRIVSITPEWTSVEIIAKSACSECHAKGFCGIGGAKTKLIEVRSSGWQSFEPGEEVEVLLETSMGHKAVWIAYVVPFFILVGALLVLSLAGASELTSGLGAIGGVALYYFIIWLLRGKLRNEYTFNIKKQ